MKWLQSTYTQQLPKGSPEKLVLAWWLRENTTVTLRWVTERLGMGHYTRVSLFSKPFFAGDTRLPEESCQEPRANLTLVLVRNN